MSLNKRLMKELKAYKANPVPFTTVEPSEDNLKLWNAVIDVQIPDKATKVNNSCPIHFLVQFSDEYPSKAPSVGFSTEFPYDDGASYTIRDDGNELNGKYVICMDLLGNFADVHTEWEGVKGSGWSPAYNISSLLVVLQTVITENISNASNHRRTDTIRMAQEYAKAHQLPEISSPLYSSPSSSQSHAVDLSKFPSFIRSLCEDLSMKLAGTEHKAPFDKLLSYLGGDAVTMSGDEKYVVEEVIDPDLKCWYTQESYKEQILGYGIQAVKKGQVWCLSTDCNLLSRNAYDDGVRTQPNKETFQCFLPSWINKSHSSNNPEWTNVLRKSIVELGKFCNFKDEKSATMFIYPEIINRMIVLMMDATSDYRASENIFGCILNLWRTFYHISEKMPNLRSEIVKKINDFITDESTRRKGVTSNIGHLLITATLLNEVELDWGLFLGAYEDESTLRRVFWLQKDNVPITARDTFNNATISRKNILFQTMFKRVIISCADIDSTLIEIESSNCKLPEKLALFLDEWKSVLREIVVSPSWETHFSLMQRQGLSAERVEELTADIVGEYNKAIEKANQLEGYHFGSGGGGDKWGRVFPGNRGGGRGRGRQDLKHEPCENFLNGYCRFGDRCRRNHFDA